MMEPEGYSVHFFLRSIMEHLDSLATAS
jgi:hypothetical protein